MGTLGELVKKWREASDLKPADLARMVGGRVKRQHIEQLEAAGNRTPRYIADLAHAMGSTVDDLLALRMPPLKGSVAVAPPPAPEVVSESLAKLPADLAALLPSDADAFGAEIVQLCERVHDRAEQRRRAIAAQPGPALPEDIAHVWRELDALPPAERRIAYAKAINAISGPPLRPERAPHTQFARALPPATPKSRPKVRR